MVVSQFYILSARGDVIVSRDFRGDVAGGCAEAFFRRAKDAAAPPPPVFAQGGVTFFHLHRNALFFVATSRQNASASLVLELLEQVARVVKDFCGTLSEEVLRRNFALVYELLDELIDAGYPQVTASDQLKQRVHNEAVVLGGPRGFAGRGAGGGGGGVRTAPSTASHRPLGAFQQFGGGAAGATGAGGAGGAAEAVLQLARSTLGSNFGAAPAPAPRNEIFVDIFEYLTVVLTADGRVTNSHVDGSIQMKSYLAGRPPLRLALNEDIVVKSALEGGGGLPAGRLQPPGAPGAPPALDDCNFHECVDAADFDALKTLTVRPPDGEFVVMNYRITDEFRVPFLVRPSVEILGPDKVELGIEVTASLSPMHYGSNLVITCPVPAACTGAQFDLFPRGTAMTTEFRARAAGAGGDAAAGPSVLWTIKKLPGGSSARLRTRLTVAASAGPSALRSHFGPVALNFEIPMFNVSNLQVRYLRQAPAHPGAPLPEVPARWVRYVTSPASYVCRL